MRRVLPGVAGGGLGGLVGAGVALLARLQLRVALPLLLLALAALLLLEMVLGLALVLLGTPWGQPGDTRWDRERDIEESPQWGQGKGH